MSLLALSCGVLCCLVLSCVVWCWCSRRVFSLCCIVVCCAGLCCIGGGLRCRILCCGVLYGLVLHVVAESIGMISRFAFALPEIQNALIEQVTS